MILLKRGRLKTREGTAALFASTNPILAKGEFAIETDTGVLKRGDGLTQYNSLRRYPENIWLPEDNGLIAATYDPADIVAFVAVAANTHLFARCWVPAGKVITNTCIYIGVAGAAVTAGQMGLFDSTTGAQVGITAVQTANFQSVGVKEIPLTAPVAAQQKGRFIYISYVVGASTTVPSLGYKGSSGGGNLKLTGGATPRWTAFAAAPPILAGPINLTLTGAAVPIWMGLS